MKYFFATFALKKFYDIYDALMLWDLGPVVWGCSLTILTAARMWGEEEGRGEEGKLLTNLRVGWKQAALLRCLTRVIGAR